MSPADREKVLANKPAEIRERILAKVREYAALDPRVCQLRLQATELRWYLMPVLRAEPKDRNARLADVPERIRGLVKARLMRWEILPPNLQQEFLDNQPIISYFSEVDITNGVNVPGAAPSNAEQARWNALPERRRQAMIAQFNDFFELSPSEKQEALGELTDPERTQMERTLQKFDQLPPSQRIECIRAFGKFAKMSAGERAEFLKNAQRWEEMTPAERKAWCDLVAHVPEWPPLPQSAIMPPMPPMPSLAPEAKSLHPAVVTNRG